MNNYVLSGAEKDNFWQLYNNGPISVDALPSEEISGLLNQGLAEYTTDEEGKKTTKLILTNKGIAFGEAEEERAKQKEEEEKLANEENEEGESTNDASTVSKEAFRIAVECTRLDTRSVSMEGMSDILRKTIGTVANGFKSFINAIKPNAPGLVINFSTENIAKQLENMPFLNISQLPMEVPQGLKAKYLTYLAALDTAVARTENTEKLIDGFTTEVASIITNRDALQSTNAKDAYWHELESSREACYATIGACFDRGNKAKQPYSKLVDRNKDWETITNNAISLCARINKVNRAKLVTKSRHLYDLLAKIESACKVGGFDTMSPEMIRSLAEGSYQTASELEFYAVVWYRVQTLTVTLNHNYDLIKRATSLKE